MTSIKLGIASFGGLLSLVLGDATPLLTALIILASCDYITGLIKSYVKQETSSAVGFVGLVKKFTMFLVIAVCIVIDVMFMSQNLPNYITGLAITFYCINEVISITENAAEIGIPIPEVITKALAQLNKEEE